MENIDRNKLLLEYQKLLKRLDSAERWAIDNNFNWDDVKKYKYKIWLERDNIIKEIEFVRELLGLKQQFFFIGKIYMNTYFYFGYNINI